MKKVLAKKVSKKAAPKKAAPKKATAKKAAPPPPKKKKVAPPPPKAKKAAPPPPKAKVKKPAPKAKKAPPPPPAKKTKAAAEATPKKRKSTKVKPGKINYRKFRKWTAPKLLAFIENATEVRKRIGSAKTGELKAIELHEYLMLEEKNGTNWDDIRAAVGKTGRPKKGEAPREKTITKPPPVKDPTAVLKAASEGKLLAPTPIKKAPPPPPPAVKKAPTLRLIRGVG